jgi:hypothetical protein
VTVEHCRSSARTLAGPPVDGGNKRGDQIICYALLNIPDACENAKAMSVGSFHFRGIGGFEFFQLWKGSSLDASATLLFRLFPENFEGAAIPMILPRVGILLPSRG